MSISIYYCRFNFLTQRTLIHITPPTVTQSEIHFEMDDEIPEITNQSNNNLHTENAEEVEMHHT
jgi:hypothetical protein